MGCGHGPRAPWGAPRRTTIEKPLVFEWFWQKLCSRLGFEGGQSRAGSFGAPKCVTVVTFERRLSRNTVKMGLRERWGRQGRSTYIRRVDPLWSMLGVLNDSEVLQELSLIHSLPLAPPTASATAADVPATGCASCKMTPASCSQTPQKINSNKNRCCILVWLDLGHHMAPKIYLPFPGPNVFQKVDFAENNEQTNFLEIVKGFLNMGPFNRG